MPKIDTYKREIEMVALPYFLYLRVLGLKMLCVAALISFAIFNCGTVQAQTSKTEIHSSDNTQFMRTPAKTLVVGSEQDFPPFATGMTADTAGGFTVDLWKAVAAEAGLDYTIRVAPFHQILQEFKEGKVNVLINLARSEERNRFADFTVPHVIVHGAIFVRKDRDDIRSERDLSAKSIIVLNADLAHDYAESKGWGKQLVLVNTAAEGLRLLAAGKHDAMLLSKLTGMQTLQTLGIGNIVPLKTHAGFSQKFAFAVPEGQSELLSKLNEGLAIVKSNGEYNVLYDKWFGLYEAKEVGMRDLLIYLIPILVAVIGISGYFFYQRRSDRKKTDEIIRGSRRLLMSVLDNMPAMIAYWKSDLHNEFGNKVYEEWFGISPKEMRGKHMREVIGEQLFALNQPYLQAVLRGEPQFFERMITDQSGVVRSTQAAYIPDMDGDKVLGFFALVTDISKLKETEWALRQSNTLLTNLAAEVPGLIYQFKMFPDGHSCFPYASEGIRDIYEVSPEDAKEDSTKVFARLHPDDFYSVIASIQESARTLLPWRFEFRVQLPRQGMRWRAGNAQPEKLDDGSIIWHGFIADITERKNAELIQFQQMEAQRNALVREVHHRIKNNLQGILGLLSLHAYQYPETAQVIQAVIGKIKSVVVVFGLQGQRNENNILLGEVITELCNAADILSPDFLKPVLDLDPRSAICLDADKAVSIALVINELITNAIKHSEGGENPEPIHISLSIHEQCAVFTIRNKSRGLPSGFDLKTGTGIGTGLTLVNFMLPRESCELSVAFEQGTVTTRLKLCSAVTTILKIG